jgi:hypothetical protein
VTDTNYKLPKSQPTISPSSPAEREQFRQLEAERYKAPANVYTIFLPIFFFLCLSPRDALTTRQAWESPWIWEIGPIRSAVAPVKKVHRTTLSGASE